MKTLRREITATFYQTPDGYDQLVAHWSRLMQDKTRRKRLTAAHHLLYLVLRGKDWQKAFTPITNRKKLENGGFYNWGGRKAVNALHATSYEDRLIAPFAEFIHPSALCAIRERVPALSWDENPLDREAYRE